MPDPDWREHGGSGSGHGAGLEDERRRPTMRLHREAFPDKRTDPPHPGQRTPRGLPLHHHGHAHRSVPRPRATGKKVVVHETMFNEARDGRLALTWAMESSDGFHEQIAGRPKPAGLDNLG